MNRQIKHLHKYSVKNADVKNEYNQLTNLIVLQS